MKVPGSKKVWRKIFCVAFALVAFKSAVITASAQMPFENCPARIEVFDVKTGRSIPAAKVEAISYLTDNVSRSRMRGGSPYFASLQEGHYAFTASAPGYKRSRHEASAWCHESYKGAMTLTIYMWKGDPTATVYMDREDFERPPYRGKYGIKLETVVLDHRPAGRFTIRASEDGDRNVDPPKPHEAPATGDATGAVTVPVEKPEVKQPEASTATPSVEGPAEVKKPRREFVSMGVVNGKAISLPKPSTPPAAKAVNASGAVNVQVTIDHDGNVINASAVSGHQLLRGAAVAAARSAKFSPQLLDGAPVKVSGIIVYNFQ